MNEEIEPHLSDYLASFVAAFRVDWERKNPEGAAIGDVKDRTFVCALSLLTALYGNERIRKIAVQKRYLPDIEGLKRMHAEQVRDDKRERAKLEMSALDRAIRQGRTEQ